ncbi:MAG: hypothetical protein Q8J97_10120 [Flavobacteriaceae bacterium]|nr:hypothetical protein [Flavobacteriaceae bacterium]
MEKTVRDKLVEKLRSIKNQGLMFFERASLDLDGCTFGTDQFGKVAKDEFWNQLEPSNQELAQELITKVVNETPLIAECARLTPYLSQTDQIEIGHAIKGIRSALRLRQYRYWGPNVLHDEGYVLGVEPAGQSDDDGISDEDSKNIFLECYDRILGIVELLNPITIETAKDNIIATNQSKTTFRPDTAFVMMWMDEKKYELEDVHNTVKKCFEKIGVEAERADDIEHDGKITEKIIEKIKSAEFLFADLTGARPNVYYEVGFAHALSKRVILFRKKGESLHFDLAGYNCPEYKNMSDLENKLSARLESMTGKTVKNRKMR